MKNSIKIFSLISLLFLCACQNEDIPGAQDRLSAVSFSASMENNAPLARTTLDFHTVKWEASDRISLFSGEGLSEKTELSIKADGKIEAGGTDVTLEGSAVSDSPEYLAVYPHADVNAWDENALTVSIPSVQTAVEGGFASGANVSVAWTQDTHLVFRNAGGLLGFRFNTLEDAAKTKKVTIKAKKSETEYHGLTGEAVLTLEGEAKIPVIQSCSADYVTLVAPVGGFRDMTTYYAVVCPGDYKDFEISFENDQETLTLSHKDRCLVSRSLMAHMNVVVDPYAGSLIPDPDDPLPFEIEIKLNFGKGWPFNEAIVAADDQTAAGETYTCTYEYEKDDEICTEDFAFVFHKGSSAYTYSSNRLNPKGEGSIQLPGIPNRYLKSVWFRVGNTAEKKIYIWDNGTKLATANAIKGSDGDTGVILNTAPGASYKLEFYSGGAAVAYIILTYTKIKPY